MRCKRGSVIDTPLSENVAPSYYTTVDREQCVRNLIGCILCCPLARYRAPTAALPACAWRLPPLEKRQAAGRASRRFRRERARYLPSAEAGRPGARFLALHIAR